MEYVYHELVIIGGGAAGLFAAAMAVDKGIDVCILEKNPFCGKKIGITGKGRCNITNTKPWEEFSTHIHPSPSFFKNAFRTMSNEDTIHYLNSLGLPTVVERGCRVYPQSMCAKDVSITLAAHIRNHGGNILTSCNVLECRSIDCNLSTKDSSYADDSSDCHSEDHSSKTSFSGISDARFSIIYEHSGKSCQMQGRYLLLATGGLSYPATGSTGDGYGFAQSFGHSTTQCFPSLTALLPEGYASSFKICKAQYISETGSLSTDDSRCNGCNSKTDATKYSGSNNDKEIGKTIEVKNIEAVLEVNGSEMQREFGDIYFTDGGIEGPIGFKISRKAVESLINGQKVKVHIDLKPAVSHDALIARIERELEQAQGRMNLNQLLRKLLPAQLIEAFCKSNGMNANTVISFKDNYSVNKFNGNSSGKPADFDKTGTEQKRNREVSKIASSLKDWQFKIVDYIGYKRAVVTAGGVSTKEISQKTMESKLVPGLYIAGELLNLDADTGGYNLQIAFSTATLAVNHISTEIRK